MSAASTRSLLKLPAVNHANLVLYMVVGYLVFGALYLGSASVAFRAPWVLEPTAIDRAVPFVAGSIWVYLSQFLLLPWALASARDDAARSRAFYSMLLATLLSVLVFALFPTHVPRPPAPTGGLLGLAWQGLRLADTPNNACPSLHVSLSALAGALLWQRKRRLIAVAWPACISASTLTTRQHVAWDIAGGLLIAALAWFLIPRLVTYDHAPRADRTAGR